MIYLVAPNATHPSGGVAVAAQWVRLLNEHGHPAMFITPNGDPSPYWLDFTVPAGSYRDMEDAPENKRVDIWMDCAAQFETHRMRHYFFAQDVCQLEHIKKEKGQKVHDEYVEILASGYHLITLTHHAHWYYLYRYGMQSKVVNNFVDTNLFRFEWLGQCAKQDVAMIRHRDHYSQEIETLFHNAGFNVRIAEGRQEEIAKTFMECRYFVSDVRGRWDGFEFSEGMPMPIMEAMACGCVPIIRDTNGIREFVFEGLNGRYFSDATASNIAKWARKMLCDDVVCSMGARAAHTIETTFSKAAAWTQIEEALELK